MATLAPLDLLERSPIEQLILRALARRPRLTVDDLAARLSVAATAVADALADLVQRGQIAEQLHQGQRVYSARYAFKRRAVRNLPPALAAVLAGSADAFLAEAPLTATLPPEARQALLDAARPVSLMAAEVFAWQGGSPARVALVRNGLLRRSRLEQRGVAQADGYVHRGEWYGLVEAFSHSAPAETVTAVSDTTLLTWEPAQFADLARRHTGLAGALLSRFGRQLNACRTQAHSVGGRRVWAVEGMHPGAGVTSLAWRLAGLAAEERGAARTLLWLSADDTPLPPDAAFHARAGGVADLYRAPNGLRLLRSPQHTTYPLQVEMDMLLAELGGWAETIVCDTGSLTEPRAQALRARADTVITLTTADDGIPAVVDRWQSRQAQALPGQKRFAALNRHAGGPAVAVDARFHLVLPDRGASGGDLFADACAEVYRRLTLSHALAIFVPSTFAVDQAADNAAQVNAALSFLGDIFGGATSSAADGVWRSEESGLVTEQITIVRTFVSKRALDEHLDAVIDFATDLKRDMQQEAVAVSVDNQLILV